MGFLYPQELLAKQIEVIIKKTKNKFLLAISMMIFIVYFKAKINAIPGYQMYCTSITTSFMQLISRKQMLFTKVKLS
jgi:hypothetical protein